MSEETVKEEVVVEEAPVLSPAEVQAREHGWKPKEEWEGDPEDWVSYREFNRRGELFARIAKYGHELKENKDALKKLFTDQRKLYEAGYSKALADLKQQKAAAVEEGDARKLLQVDEEIESLKENHQNVVKDFEVQTADIPTPNYANQVALEQWMVVNPWYNSDNSLRAEADQIAQGMFNSAKSQGKPIEINKLLSEVSRQVKSRFPDKFPKQKTSPVDGGSHRETSVSSSRSTKYSLDKIPTEGEREIARVVMKSTGLSEEEYVKQYMSAGRR